MKNEIELLNTIHSSLSLEAEEIKLIHERDARRRAIDIAHSLIVQSNNRQDKANSSTASVISSDEWCRLAVFQFKVPRPTLPNRDWGNMVSTDYRKAWLNHQCDAKVFPSAPTVKTSILPTLPQNKAFSYLANENSIKRRKITVVVWNKVAYTILLA